MIHILPLLYVIKIFWPGIPLNVFFIILITKIIKDDHHSSFDKDDIANIYGTGIGYNISNNEFNKKSFS